ncbi:MAG: DUF1778 domain-containing protein [Ancrocorticia sp.]
MPSSTKTERIQLRISSEAKQQIIEAAETTQQDLTSFILDAATARAREVLLERTVIKLHPDDYAQILADLESPVRPSPVLARLFRETDADPRIIPGLSE